MSVEDERKLFVAGLAETATEQGLRELFESTGGTVEEITVPRDRSTGKVRGFAFLTMGTVAEAGQARQQLDGSLQDGRSISVREFRGDRTTQSPPRASQPPPDGEDTTLYVGNLPFDAQTQDVQELFGASGFSEVRRVHLPTDADGRARGFGFVTLGSADDARRAVEEMAGASLRGRPLSISVARARGKPAPRPSRPPTGGGGYGGGFGPSAGAPRPPARPARPIDAGSESAGAFRPPPPPEFGGGGFDGGDNRRSAKWEKKKEKKRKNRLQADRGGKKRRGDEEDFRSMRPDDYADRWDDD